MINYIWVAFIVMAILYAGFLEVTGKPPVEQPDPIVLADYETSGTVTGDAAIVKETRDGKSTASLQVPYDLRTEDWSEAALGLSIAPKYDAPTAWKDTPMALAPEKLTLAVRGDGSGNLLTFAVRDKDGELFFPAAMTRLDSAETWKKVTLTLAELTPASATPGASLDLPATVELRVVRSDASSSASGAVLLDSVAVGLPAVRHDGGKYEADSWMGVATESVAEWAKVSIELAISLIGLMMLWLGLMKIAEEAGLVRLLARAVKPVMVFLFPDIPADSPAMGAILMNIAANMLGLGNAATPLGIKAMHEMQKDNPSSTYASNAQCMLLAVNTSSVIILPAGIIAYRAAQGSVELMKFWPVMLATTAISTTVAVVACKLLEKLPIFAVPPDALDKVGIAAREKDA